MPRTGSSLAQKERLGQKKQLKVSPMYGPFGSTLSKVFKAWRLLLTNIFLTIEIDKLSNIPDSLV